MKRMANNKSMLLEIFSWSLLLTTILYYQPKLLVRCQAQSQKTSFPGVSRDLSSFCAGRPSLPIDLASMVVHVKRNVSFNYKLYLFSAEHVFQTGQVIPRDDFRVHSFPVSLKRINEFWPDQVPVYQIKEQQQQQQQAQATNDQPLLVQVPSKRFDLKQFLKLSSSSSSNSKVQTSKPVNRTKKAYQQITTTSDNNSKLPDDLHAHALPGDPEFSHEAGNLTNSDYNINKHIQFDRDDGDQVAALTRTSGSHDDGDDVESHRVTRLERSEFSVDDSVIPVGSFSSFHVNLTYLVRKDFGQIDPQLIRIQVDSSKFLVTQVVLLSGFNGTKPAPLMANTLKSQRTLLLNNEDYRFLSHKLLRDPNTRITAINQIYEDWITRNFYTVVYIQRKLEDNSEDSNQELHQTTTRQPNLINDRLIFRGSSQALIGADQIDYSVKAAAFITEKNGLHYYLEFLPTNKFYLCAIDWTKRPFKIIDSRRFPIKQTKTQLDNEELLLCPPSVCYSTQPVDEIVAYGRINLPAESSNKQIHEQHDFSAPVGARYDTSASNDGNSSFNETALIYETTKQQHAKEQHQSAFAVNHGDLNSSNYNLARNVMGGIKLHSSGSQLETKLHLRDWTWLLARQGAVNSQHLATSFELRYESARRNDIKAKPDNYGYVLTGHEIDASYRIYNELYLISANHLISINYTLANETVIGAHPIGDEFFGLSSTLMDPITGAFYDRFSNEVYFFKGDRYLGYNYATKKPLDDFLVEVPQTYVSPDIIISSFESETKPLISSQPVVGIVGRQHQIDGVYHDFQTDLVYIFSGMKFYTFEAREFKTGSFRSESQRALPPMLCINEHFLDGCTFDKAFQNPCQDDEGRRLKQTDDTRKSGKLSFDDNDGAINANRTNSDLGSDGDTISGSNKKEKNFTEEQQLKLRSIAMSQPNLGWLSLLVENTILRNDAAKAIEATATKLDSQPRTEKVVIYFLMAMIVLTVLVTIVMIVILINWTRVKLASSSSLSLSSKFSADANLQQQQQQQQQIGRDAMISGSRSHRNHYLSNQQQHLQSRRHPYLHASHGSDNSAAGLSRANQALAIQQDLNRHPQTSSSSLTHSKPFSGGSQVSSRNKIRRPGNSIDNSAL